MYSNSNEKRTSPGDGSNVSSSHIAPVQQVLIQQNAIPHQQAYSFSVRDAPATGYDPHFADDASVPERDTPVSRTSPRRDDTAECPPPRCDPPRPEDGVGHCAAGVLSVALGSEHRRVPSAAVDELWTIATVTAEETAPRDSGSGDGRQDGKDDDGKDDDGKDDDGKDDDGKDDDGKEDGVIPPRDIVLVCDKSGSMSGRKVELLRVAVRFVVAQMRGIDRMSIVEFDSRAWRLTPLVRGDAGGKIVLNEAAESLSAGGGTDITAGAACGARVLASRCHGRPAPVTALFLMTDGHGPLDVDALGPRFVEMECPVYTFGLGEDHDAALLGSLASATGGIHTYVEDNVGGSSAGSSSFGSKKKKKSGGSKFSLSRFTSTKTKTETGTRTKTKTKTETKTKTKTDSKKTASKKKKAPDGGSSASQGGGFFSRLRRSFSSSSRSRSSSSAESSSDGAGNIEAEDDDDNPFDEYGTLPEAFAVALGGMSSIVASAVRVSLRAPEGAVLHEVHGGAFEVSGTCADGAVTVVIPSIFAGETKSIPVVLRLPRRDTGGGDESDAARSQAVLRVDLAFDEVTASDREPRASGSFELTVIRDASVKTLSPAQGAHSVMVQRLRVATMRATREASQLADRGSASDAEGMITATIEQIKAALAPYSEGNVPDELVPARSLLTDLEDLLTSIRARESRSKISVKAWSCSARHEQQRSNTIAGDCYQNSRASKSRVTATKFKKASYA